MALMKFDMDRYKRRTFHKDELTDKRIKALFLLFDYEITRKKMPLTAQLTAIDDWINKFEQHELYEVIPMFKLRRGVIVRQIITNKREQMTFKEFIVPEVKTKWGKIINFFKSLFKRK